MLFFKLSNRIRIIFKQIYLSSRYDHSRAEWTLREMVRKGTPTSNIYVPASCIIRLIMLHYQVDQVALSSR